MPALISSALHVAAAHLQRVPLSSSRERDSAVPTVGLVSRDSRGGTAVREG